MCFRSLYPEIVQGEWAYLYVIGSSSRVQRFLPRAGAPHCPMPADTLAFAAFH
jgi:hypothetical protein